MENKANTLPNIYCISDEEIQHALDEGVKQGYLRKLKGDKYKLTNKGKGYAECLIKMIQGEL